MKSLLGVCVRNPLVALVVCMAGGGGLAVFSSSASAADTPKVAHDLNYSDYVGRYPIDEDFVIDIIYVNTRLWAQPVGQPKRKLRFLADDKFIVEDSHTQFWFMRDASGKVDSMTLHREDEEDRMAKRQALKDAGAEREEVKLTDQELAEYVGNYQYAEDMIFTVSLGSGTILVQAPRQPKLPVYAEKKDSFFYKVAEATLSFSRGADGHIVSLTLHQRNQEITATRKTD